MTLLEGDLARVFSTAFSGIYVDATLHRATLTDSGDGGGTSSFANESVKAQLDAATQAMQRAQGFVDSDQRILVLAYGVAPISTDDEITIAAHRWSIASVTRDPAGAAYELRGRRKSAVGA